MYRKKLSIFLCKLFVIFLTIQPAFTEGAETYRFQHLFPLLLQPWYFNEARDLAVDWDGNLYIADSNNNTVKKFTADGHLILQLRLPSDSVKVVPLYIETDPDNREIYVLYRRKETAADFPNHLLRRFSSEGNFLAEWEGTQETLGTDSIATDSQGRIFIAASYETGDPSLVSVRQINIFSRDMELVDTRVIEPLGENTGTCTQSPDPVDIDDIALDSRDFLYVLKAGKDPFGIYSPEIAPELRKYSPDGSLIACAGGKGSEPGRFGYPERVTVDGSDQVYVTDKLNSRVQKFSENLEFVSEFANEAQADAEARHNLIESAPLGSVLKLLEYEAVRDLIGALINVISCPEAA